MHGAREEQSLATDWHELERITQEQYNQSPFKHLMRAVQSYCGYGRDQ